MLATHMMHIAAMLETSLNEVCTARCGQALLVDAHLLLIL